MKKKRIVYWSDFGSLAISLLLVFLLHQLAVWTPVSIARDVAVGTENESYNFIAYGDSRAPDLPEAVSPFHEDIVGAYLRHDPEFIIHTGDMALAGGLWYQWIEFNESIAAVLEAGIPIYGVVGNHEKYTSEWYVYDEGFDNYQTYFNFDQVIDETGENELYYSFDYEGIHFIFLNTEDYFDDVEGGSSTFECSAAQRDWLQSDLSKTHPNDFIVASFHRTAWSIREGRPDRWEEAETIRDDFHSVFVQNGVDLVLMGHDHYYYHTFRDGIHYVTTGGGGAPLAGIDSTSPIWQEGDVAISDYHYCNVEVNSTHVNVTAMMLNSTTIDSFSINRVPPNNPPVASFSFSPTEPTVLDTVQFYDASEDPDGTIVSWRWDFGDGSTSTYSTTTHRYTTPGEKIVTLTVTDDREGEHSATKIITVTRPAEIEVSNLIIEPDSVEVGETLTISVVCTNSGGRQGSHTIILEIDGVEEDEKGVILDPEESDTISFEISASEAGMHNVKIDGLTGTFEVEKASFLDRIPGFTYESIMLGLAMGAYILRLIQQRRAQNRLL